MNHRAQFRNSLIALSAIAALILTVWIAHYGPSWPFQDSFAYMYFMDRIHSGDFHFIDLPTVRNNEHLVGFHYAFAMASLWLSNMRSKFILFENAALLLASGLLIAVTLRKSQTAQQFSLILPIVSILPLLNPVQTSYLLWEFQIWWYLDFFMLAASIFLVERFAIRAYPFVVVLSALATMSEAQGSFLWLSSGMHFFLLSRDENSKKISARLGMTVLAVHSLVFGAAAVLLLKGNTPVTPGAPAAQMLIHRLVSHLDYFLKLLGGGFGVNHQPLALVFGCVSAIALVYFVVVTFRPRWPIELRVAFLLTALPLLWTAAFAVGREKYGIPWAFSDFHASPMLVPFFIGLAIYALASARQAARYARSLGIASAVAFAVVPVLTAIPFGHSQSHEMHMSSMMGIAANCYQGNYSRYLIQHLDGLQSHDVLFDLTRRDLAGLCAVQHDPAQWVPLLQPPALFVELGKRDVRTNEALRVLWDVYLTHVDLRKAFEWTDPRLGQTLIEFAAGYAEMGSPYENKILGPYQDVYPKLRQ